MNADTAKKVELQHVLGLTAYNHSALGCNPRSSTIAYPAGCVVVLYNTRKNKQRHLISEAKRSISALAFSWDGKYLVTGECGPISHVRVWDVEKLVQVTDLSGHKHGINCVAFSPNMKHVVSVGSEHDLVVNVWDWRNKVRIASNKVSCKVNALSFSESGNYFVTVGHNHVKFWYLEDPRAQKHKLEPVPLMGRSAILGDQRNNHFYSVACGRGQSADSTFAVTKSGLLCEFNERRLLDKWVELRISVAYSLSVGENLIVVGCSEGIVRCFSPFDLSFVCTLPRPHYLGVDVAKGFTGRQITSHPPDSKYPEVIAVTLDETNKKVICIYNDHSLYVWDIKSIKKIGKSHSFLYHSACIWDIEMNADDQQIGFLPEDTFFTCASDDTIRIWNLGHKISQNSEMKRNIYCHELLKILYIDPNMRTLCNTDSCPNDSKNTPVDSYDTQNGIRCLRIRPDGLHLASGDRSGNIRIYDLQCYELLCEIQAHDDEVLCLEYSKFSEKDQLLTSTSRDKLVHLFDVEKAYEFLKTLDEHTSAVTSTKFVSFKGDHYLVSCAADKSIIIRRVKLKPTLMITKDHTTVDDATFYDMSYDSQNCIIAASQDNTVKVFNVPSGKQTYSLCGNRKEGSLIKVVMDATRKYVAASSTDKTIYIFSYLSGQCVATIHGHSELVTGLKFSFSGNNLISVSGNGCIFIWKLNLQNSKVSQQTPVIATGDTRKPAVAITKPYFPTRENGVQKHRKEVKETNIINYQLNVEQLPSWAKKQVADDPTGASDLKGRSSAVQPRGRWAERVEGQHLVMKSYMQTDSTVPVPQIPGLNAPSEATETKEVKMSSIESEQNFERIRHPTDSSSASSQRMEDGDAEDERSDSGLTDNSELVYLPPSADANCKETSFHIFPVSQDKKLKTITNSHLSVASLEKTFSNSEEDDESSFNDSERKLRSSSFSPTMENRVGFQEKFMVETFKSMENPVAEEKKNTNRLSISSKHHTTRSKTLSTSFAKDVKLVSSGKREELAMAINDAKRKLETLGIKSGLSTSKSVGDLSNTSDNVNVQEKIRIRKTENYMRRSTSYGNIALNRSQRRQMPSTPVQGDQSAPLWDQACSLWDQANHQADSEPSYAGAQQISKTVVRTLKRSVSSTYLPQSNGPVTSVVMKKKTNFYQHSLNKNVSLNKSMSNISVNVSTPVRSSTPKRQTAPSNGNLHDTDSSSSDASAPESRVNTIVPKGLVARRMKAFCSEQSNRKQVTTSDLTKKHRHKSDLGKSKSDWDLRQMQEDPESSPTLSAKSGHFRKSSMSNLNGCEVAQNGAVVLSASPVNPGANCVSTSEAGELLNFESLPLTRELCDKVSNELKNVSAVTAQLIQRLTADPSLKTPEKSQMTTTLVQSVRQAQQNLQRISDSPTMPQAVPNPPDASAMLLLQQYSDRLLTLFEKKITSEK